MPYRKKRKFRELNKIASNGKMFAIWITSSSDEQKIDSYSHIEALSIEETTSPNEACYIVRNTPQRDAYACPWCVKNGAEDVKSCLDYKIEIMTEKLFDILNYKEFKNIEELDLINAEDFPLKMMLLDIYECKKTRKLFLVELRPITANNNKFNIKNKDGNKRLICPACGSGNIKKAIKNPQELHNDSKYHCLTCHKTVHTSEENQKELDGTDFTFELMMGAWEKSIVTRKEGKRKLYRQLPLKYYR